MTKLSGHADEHPTPTLTNALAHSGSEQVGRLLELATSMHSSPGGIRVHSKIQKPRPMRFQLLWKKCRFLFGNSILHLFHVAYWVSLHFPGSNKAFDWSCGQIPDILTDLVNQVNDMLTTTNITVTGFLNTVLGSDEVLSTIAAEAGESEEIPRLLGFQPYDDDSCFRETIEPFPYELEVTEIGEVSGNRHKDSDFQGMIALDIKGRHRTVKAQQDNKQFQITWNCWTFPPNLWEARCELTITQQKEKKTGGNIDLLTALGEKNGASAKKAVLKAVGDQGILLLFAVCGLPHIRACSCGCGPKKKKVCEYTLFGNLG
ncbi:hypothetical protein B0H14DRAFT_2780762 [Mycena olivaceomarginata]|nr:hypothetical protein B0H14DRAFT_2890066 [Mycena olivaceomarginata]KAJ7842481.1 hypothetical protein B0H14DRAFT_2780762 [Mycena olivaceomarginata]